MASFQDFKDNALSILVVGMFGMIWNDIHTMNEKMDMLVQLTAESKVRIDGLEREVYKTGSIDRRMPPFKLPLQVRMMEVVAIRPEQDYSVKKYITTI
jgi:hypothetical protein